MDKIIVMFYALLGWCGLLSLLELYEKRKRKKLEAQQRRAIENDK